MKKDQVFIPHTRKGTPLPWRWLFILFFTITFIFRLLSSFLQHMMRGDDDFICIDDDGLQVVYKFCIQLRALYFAC